MALSPTEESLVRQLIAQNPALLNLASSESTIISKLGATKVSLSDLSAATSLSDADLALVRQGLNDKSFAMSVLRDYVSANLPTASTTTKGIVELATNTETQTGTDAVRAVTPAGLASVTATETRAGLLEIATTAEAQALTDDTKALTPKKLADAFGLRVGHTFTDNDWTPIFGGLILQWGSVTVGASASATVTFPIAFPNSCFVVVESNAYTTSGVIGSVQITGVITKTNFPVLNKTSGGSVIYRWMAIGN